MTDYNATPDEDLEPGKPWTSIKAIRMRDNPIAIAEGAAGAPRIQNAAMDTDSVDNANVVNGTLGSEKFQTGPDERDWVLGRTAGAAVGAVGTYAFLGNNSTGEHAPGDTAAGSGLDWGSANADGIEFYTATSPSGTWRCMGFKGGSNAANGNATVWLRIS